MSTTVSDKDILLIAARHWLHTLVERFEIDPEATVIEALTLSKDGKPVVKEFSLADTMAGLDELTVTITTKADND